MNAILGPTNLHWASNLCRTQYREFHSPFGVHGLADETNDGNTLHILAVSVNPFEQRQGRFRSFIAEAKKQYSEIFVWAIENPNLESALNRYGFAHTNKTQWDWMREDYVTVEGMVWKKTTK
jgi:hypothetical protein